VSKEQVTIYTRAANKARSDAGAWVPGDDVFITIEGKQLPVAVGDDLTVTISGDGTWMVTSAATTREQPAWSPEVRVNLLTSLVGGVRELARLLGVSASQPSRWASGKEFPSPDLARQIIDLDHVMALLVQQWHPSVAVDWLRNPNRRLGGATPLEVIRARGSAEVLAVIEGDLAGILG
jgi:transcriptional regulator with XRE-family HTH domain